MKRKSRTPIVTVIRRGTPHAVAAPAPSSSRTQPTAPPTTAPLSQLTATPAPVLPTPGAPSTHTDEQRLPEREARLVARAAPHGDAIRRLLDEASAANGGAWPHRVHARIAEALGLSRRVVHAFLATLRERPGP